MKILKLFANCIPTFGYKRSIITDLQFGKIIPIPNSLYKLLMEFKGRKLEYILSHYEVKDHETITEYFNYLSENKLINPYADNIDFFPDLSLTWDYPAKVTNAIIQYSKNYFKESIQQLEHLNCKVINIIYEYYNPVEFVEIIEILNSTSILAYEFQLDKMKIINLNDAILLFQKYNRIQNIFIFNSVCSKIIPRKNFNIYLMKESFNPFSCGNISYYNFTINIPFFSESQYYNTCLNRKVGIDKDGFVKNCLSMNKNYGNIKNITLNEVISSCEFQKFGCIKKDDIEVCKDCEFRYMCPDCRAFLKDPGNIYSQPAKCEYNPYIAKWKGEEGYVPVEE